MPANLVRHKNTLALLLILLLAAGLRFYALDDQSFWADEGNSVVLAGKEWGEIVRAAAADIHPPAYYLILSAWGKVFGLSEVGARSLSALFGVLLVWIVYLLGARLRNSLTGLIAAALAAVNPFLIFYSQEARMYELLALCAAITAYALVLWLAPTRSPVHSHSRAAAAVLYGIFATLGLYTHYAFPIHLIALNLVFFTQFAIRTTHHATRNTQHATRNWLLLQLTLLLFFLPWLPTALRQLTTWPAPATTLSPGQALTATFQLFLCGPTSCLDTALLLPVAVIILALLVIALLPRWPTRGSWLEMALPLLWLLTPLAAMFAFGVFSPVFFKFLIIAVPAYLLLLAIGIDRLTWASGRTPLPRARCLLPALLVAFLALPSLQALDRYYHDPAVARDDYRSIALYVKAIADEHDAVILNAPGQIDAFSQYDHGDAALYPLPRTRPLDEPATIAELDRILAEHNRIYAIYWATEQSDPEGVIERYLAERAFKAWDSWVGDLRFVAYSAEPPPAATQLVFIPRFGDHIKLDAVGFNTDPLQPGDIAQVLLRWTTDAPLDENYKVSLQLLDAVNQVVAQVDSEPVGGKRPTSAWQAFETIDDPYGLPIPLATPPGDYPLILAIYDPQTGVRLPVTTNEGVSDHFQLGAVRIDAPDQAPPLAVLPTRYPDEAIVGPFTFLGHNRFKQGFGHAPDTPLLPGDALHLTTFWRADAQPEGDYAFELRLDDAPLGRFQLAGPGYATSQWEPGFPWRGEHTAILPPELATGGKHTLLIQLLGPNGEAVGEPIPLEPPLIY
ncbi:MAG TPA: hypothetical protein G4N94_04695 [Caldilineae bacterium]|nr:hypothetical protein [Caldilineae bacterium]